MTPEEIATVHESAGRIAGRRGLLSESFYRRLFAEHPEVRAMFPADMRSQEEKFADTVAAIVEAIPDFGAFTERSRQLGRLHAAHRVEPGQYDVVGAVLLGVLAEYDEEWNADVESAWTSAYSLLAESMMLGARG